MMVSLLMNYRDTTLMENMKKNDGKYIDELQRYYIHGKYEE